MFPWKEEGGYWPEVDSDLGAGLETSTVFDTFYKKEYKYT